MKKAIYGSILVLIIVILVAFVRMDISVDNYDFSLSGSNSDFLVTLESNGYDIFYKWDGTWKIWSIGGTKMDMVFIGNEHILNSNPTISYSYRFETSGGSGSSTGNLSRNISSSRSSSFYRELEDEYIVNFSVNGNPSMVRLVVNED